jgi:chromosome segregation ATPase
MLSGREALETIDEALGKLRHEADALGSGFQKAGAKLTEARQTQLGLYARIARVRLQELERGSLADTLDDADRRVTEIVAARQAAQARLAEEIAAAEEKQAALERDRAARQTEAAAAAEAVDAAEADAQQRLAADDEYRTLLENAERSDAVADQAEEKARASASDRAEKGRPYEADPIFMYLWNRGFGTTRYRAWTLTRLLDRWAARVVSYEAQRRNYRLLTEIPERLGEHAKRMRELADVDIEAARAVERRAAEAANVPERERELDLAEQRLAEADRAIEDQEALLDELIEKRTRFASGEDDFSAQATALLRDRLRQEDLHSLRKRTARTQSPEDDALVGDLETLEDELEQLEEERIQYRRLHQAQRERMLGLEDIRKRFKRSRYDDVHSAFVNAALIGLLLDRFVGGSVGADEVWDAIRRQQRFRQIRANPTFGTGRFPGGRFPGPWHMPGGGGGWNFPRGGGFGGGGFGTGGGFGGGGFKTGGGF